LNKSLQGSTSLLYIYIYTQFATTFHGENIEIERFDDDNDDDDNDNTNNKLAVIALHVMDAHWEKEVQIHAFLVN
jgi:hypothetical protein